MGNDPVSGKPMVVKDGRFGPYVTDGEYNASLRKSDSVETPDRRARGRADRREAREGPGPQEEAVRRRSPPAAKKAPAKTKS